MNHQEFVEHNVRQQLLKEGFSAALANIGASKAVQHYRRLSQASKRGGFTTIACARDGFGPRNRGLWNQSKNHGARYHASASYSGEVFMRTEISGGVGEI